MTSPARNPTGTVISALLASGAIGFFFGMVRHPQWQDALEPAQVLAGLVHYPLHNSVYAYSTGVWTVLHQALAMLLRWGWSEQTLALLLSGLLGMLSLQALAIFILALSDDLWLAVAGSFLIYWADATNPVSLMNTWTTYGVVGLSYMLLTIGLFGTGHAASGAALLGFSLAVHPAWGLWGISAVAFAWVTDRPTMRAVTTRIWPFFIGGLAASALSAWTHYLSGGLTTGPHFGPTSIHLTAFIARWDAHRQAIGVVSHVMAAVYFSAGLGAYWLWRFRDITPPRVALMLRTLVAAAILGSVLSLAYRLPASAVPEMLLALMPSRLLDLSAMTGTALIIGLAGRYRTDPAMQLLVVSLMLGLCLVPQQHALGPAWFAHAITIVAAPILLFLAHRRRKPGAYGVGLLAPGLRVPDPARAVALLRPTAFAVAAAIVAYTASTSALDFERTRRLAFGRDDALTAASRRPGLLLTAGGMHLVQLRTRRAVLIDGGALDSLNYAPAAGPEMARVLLRVYGVDLFHPEAALASAHNGALQAGTGRELWESWGREDWLRVAAEFGVTDVLTPAQWSLVLPVIATSPGFTLYHINVASGGAGLTK